METFIGRYRNVSILAALLFGQVLGLAMQVQRPTENRPTRLIRIWAVSAVTPFEKGIVGLQNGVAGLWHNYFYLRGVRQENRDLRKKIQDLEIERVRLNEDAEQARRLQVLLGFKEQFISKTIAAQVIGSSGSEQSRSVYIDKGSRDGLKPDMPVMTGDGIVGKVLRVFKSTSQVLLINDQTSGVGAILEKSRLQGVLRGTPAGEIVLEKVMTDEPVQPGEHVVTSGGDQIFPKGLPVGTVTRVSPGAELFLNIRVKPAADMNRLEEVLVITQEEDREPQVADTEHLRASDILAARLPSVPDKPATPPAPGTNPTTPGATTTGTAKPTTLPTTANAKPAATNGSITQLGANANKPANTQSEKLATKPPVRALTGIAPASQKPVASGTKPAPKTLNPASGQPSATTVRRPAPADGSQPANQAPANQIPADQNPANPIPTTPPPQDQPQ
ncbi:MAG TPA: rod shape-determining protein MreC [Terriglobales bacterium]|nr:rod shape-determining protein MreC [Terriglobales bacterium]